MKIKRLFTKLVALTLFAAMTAGAAYAAPGGYGITAAPGDGKGSVSVSANSAPAGAVVTGKAAPAAGYDLATVRYVYSAGGAETYGFAALTKTEDGYTYAFTMPDADVRVIPFFFSATVWDGAVDISWYDPDAFAYAISRPAQLAGLAALVNGMTDRGTPDYMIKGDRSYIACAAYPDILLVGAGGGNVSDTVYAGTTDFAYKTVRLTADLNMGGVYDAGTNTWSGPNYTPVGGKYSMATDEAAGDPFVIDSRFNGVFDGQGHTVSNIYCQRYAAKGFPYSMAVGLIGFLGGPGDVSGISGTFENGWRPAVRNVTVGAGYIYGRRMVGGVVGRTGETNNGVIVESCANYATVKNTDSKGVGGVVGAGWGKGFIRYCYNAGDVSTTFPCPAGGICGSNGGIDIYNCFNVGTISSNGQLMGRGIGGHEEGKYTVSNCYTLQGCDDDTKSGGYYVATSKNITVSVSALSSAEMRTDGFLKLLNAVGSAFVPDSAGKNGGYPILFFESPGYDTAKTFSVTLKQPETGGTIASDVTSSVPWGKVLNLSSDATAGFKLKYYTVNGEKLTTPFVAVTENIEIGAVFGEVKPVKLSLPESDDFAVIATKTGYELCGGEMVYVRDKAVYDGDTILEENLITVRAYGYPDAAPDDPDLEYTGGFTYTATNAQRQSDGVFIADGGADVVVTITRGTQPKTWASVADSSWYDENAVKESYVLTTPEQLAGLISLVNNDGVTFAGITICLDSDISLSNTDGRGGTRVWRAIGASAFKAFKGVFDGQGHTIRHMTAYSSGSYAGLFGYCIGAVIKNVTVRGEITGGDLTSYAAGIAASVSATVIENCQNYTAVDIKGSNAAGIAGYISDGSTVSSCTNFAAVTGASGVGGIVGVSYTATDVIESCRNTGLITATGGGTSGAGGIAGKLAGKLDGCCSTGSVGGEDRYTGGIVGYASGKNSSSVTSSYNTGSVSSSCDKVNSAVGGLVGYAQYITLENSYNAGAVTAGADFSTGNKGGVVGRLGVAGCAIANCYYLDTSCSDAAAGTDIGGALAMTADALKASGFPDTLGQGAFKSAGYINSGFPVLSWETDAMSLTVTYSGDYTGTDTMPYGGSAELPEAPPGYTYRFVSNGSTWDGRNITSDMHISVTKSPRTYTVIFKADGVIVGQASFQYGQSAVTAPAPPQKAGYTVSWPPYKLGSADMTIMAVYRQITVRGGDRITQNGTYFVQYYSTGAIEIGDGLNVVLNGENGGAAGFDGLTLTVGSNTALTLTDFKTTGETTLMTLKGGDTLTLRGDSALVGVSDVKGNIVPTVSAEGSVTVAGDGALTVKAGLGNAAVHLAAGAVLTQESGTLNIVKTDLLGEAGGAVNAPDGDVVIEGGTFTGTTDSDNVSIISARSITVSGGSVTATALKSPVALDSKSIEITGGSVKAVGHSGNSMTEQRYFYNDDAMPGVADSLAPAVIGVGWADAAQSLMLDGRAVTLGSGHYCAADMTAGTTGAVDAMLWLWLAKTDHTLTLGDKEIALKWDAIQETFRLTGPVNVFEVLISGGGMTIKAASGPAPDLRLMAAAYDATGKMTAYGAYKSDAEPMTLTWRGWADKVRLILEDAGGQPVTDFAFIAGYTQ